MEMEKKVEEKHASTSAWPYLISGVAIGAALGVLFAPDSGEETRKNVTNWLKEKRAQGRRWSLARKHGRQVTPAEHMERIPSEV